MKGSLLLAFAIITNQALISQTISSSPPTMGEAKPVVLPENKTAHTCGNDTLLYTLNKATAAETQGFGFPTSYSGVAQRYAAPQPITVYGACYYAFTDISGTGPGAIVVRLHDLDTNNLPGTILANANDTLPMGTGTPFVNYRRCVTWGSPVTVSSDFYLALDGSGTNEPIGLTRNSYTNSDGAGEALSAVHYNDGSGLSYVKWYNQTTDPAFVSPGPAWDYDYLIEPITSHNVDISVSFTNAGDTICLDETVCVTMDSLSVMSHPMYSVSTVLPPTVVWGDGTDSQGNTVCHNYMSGGNYTIKHSVKINGWMNSCFITTVDSVFVEDPTASFSYTINLDTVTFTNTSPGGTSRLWDYDGITTSVAMDSSHVFGNGPHTVELICYTPSGCSDTTSQTFFITVGISEQSNDILSFFPNPTEGVTNIRTNNNIKTIEVFDMIGKRIVSVSSVTTPRINLENLAPGTYVIRVETDKSIRTGKILLK